MALTTRCVNVRLASKDLYQIPKTISRVHGGTRLRSSRGFSTSRKNYQKHTDNKESFGTRLRKALGDTKIKWYPIPVGLGIGFLGLAQMYKINERENAKRQEIDEENDGYVYSKGEGGGGGQEGRPKRRERIRPTGPWFVIGFDKVAY